MRNNDQNDNEDERPAGPTKPIIRARGNVQPAGPRTGGSAYVETAFAVASASSSSAVVRTELAELKPIIKGLNQDDLHIARRDPERFQRQHNATHIDKAVIEGLLDSRLFELEAERDVTTSVTSYVLKSPLALLLSVVLLVLAFLLGKYT